MTVQTLNNQIKTGSFSQYYLICGEEEYMKRFYRDKLSTSILGEDIQGNINYHYYDKTSATEDNLITQADCLPFFSDKQLIVVENSGLFKSSSSLADALENIPESTYIIFVENDVDKRNALYKFIKNKGTVASLDYKKDTELTTWIAYYLKPSGCRITMRAAKLIISKCGVDMYHLANELEKLISYVGDSKDIDIEQVEAICTVTLNSKVFLMMDYIVSGRQDEAMNLYRDILLTKVPVGRVLFLLTKHINTLISIKEMTHDNDMDIAKKLGVPSFAVKKYRAQSSSYRKVTLQKCLTDCVNTDADIKTGKIQDNLALELLILTLSSRKHA